MKTFLASIGAVVLLLSFLGAVGAGNFLLKFSTKPIVCIEESK
jgi:hypothetical protein